MFGLRVVRVLLSKTEEREATYKMDLGQVFTNSIVAKYMASLFNLDKNDSILDPCFGDGAFLKACMYQGYNNISGYELDEKLFNEVRTIYPTLNLFNKDFLSIKERAIAGFPNNRSGSKGMKESAINPNINVVMQNPGGFPFGSSMYGPSGKVSFTQTDQNK